MPDRSSTLAEVRSWQVISIGRIEVSPRAGADCGIALLENVRASAIVPADVIRRFILRISSSQRPSFANTPEDTAFPFLPIETEKNFGSTLRLRIRARGSTEVTARNGPPHMDSEAGSIRFSRFLPHMPAKNHRGCLLA